MGGKRGSFVGGRRSKERGEAKLLESGETSCRWPVRGMGEDMRRVVERKEKQSDVKPPFRVLARWFICGGALVLLFELGR